MDALRTLVRITAVLLITAFAVKGAAETEISDANAKSQASLHADLDQCQNVYQRAMVIAKIRELPMFQECTHDFSETQLKSQPASPATGVNQGGTNGMPSASKSPVQSGQALPSPIILPTDNTAKP